MEKPTFSFWFFNEVLKTPNVEDPVYRLANNFRNDINWPTDIKQPDELVRYVLSDTLKKAVNMTQLLGACMQEIFQSNPTPIENHFHFLKEHVYKQTKSTHYVCTLAWRDYEVFLKNYLQ